MDVCSSGGKSVPEDENNSCPLSVDPPHSSYGVTGPVSVSELGNYLTEFLKIQDNSASDSIQPSAKKVMTNMKKEDVCEGSHESRLVSVNAEKCFNKCASFPGSHKITSPEDEERGVVKDKEDDLIAGVLVENGNAKTVAWPPPRTISLPTPSKLLSAMKGSREKQGAHTQKLTVTWAPDVYDPTPSAASHVATNKPQRHRNDSKKNGKNKQKGSGKSTRGSKGKEKKQARKHGGSSNRGFKRPDDDGRVVDCGVPQVGMVDFNVGCPDPFCGHSFLKQSVTKLHFSVAEAT
ncbi:unnamed protein product [Ilex paraguariensis]|uniref:C2H2-type domain-containing protein n=1 Tax=Ilex paraguariensis TaxID=185542 RepID=A0ABC8RQQ0_9AQUA